MPSNRLKLAVLAAIGVLVVVVVGLAVALVTMRSASRSDAGSVVVEVSDKTCTPDTLSVAAGTPTFTIRNTSQRAIEWEILSGVMVVAERENIVPGFTVELTPRLEPGTYQMTCGLLSNPRGTLTVTAADGSANALPAAPRLADLVAPTAEYRVYVIKSAGKLADAVAAAGTAGDPATARARLAAAEAALGQLAPVWPVFSTTALTLAEGPNSLQAADKALAANPAPADMPALLDAASRAATAFSTAAQSTTAGPRDIIAGANAALTALAAKPQLPPDAAARIAGIRRIAELFRPLAQRADKALASKLDADLAAAETALGKANGTTPQPEFTELAADMTALQAAFGLITT